MGAAGVAAWASVEALGEGDGEASSHGGDRVWNMPLRADRGRLWVGNDRERQVFGTARRHMVLRGRGIG